MRTDTPKTIYLKDYKPYPFEIKHVNLDFNIQDGETIVTAKSQFKRLSTNAKEIFMYGEDLELLSVQIDGVDLNDYNVNEASIRIPCR